MKEKEEDTMETEETEIIKVCHMTSHDHYVIVT